MKYRPVALSESPVKFIESSTIQEEAEQTIMMVEPFNMGLGTPDAAAVTVKVARCIAQTVKEGEQTPKAGADALVALDLRNAYG